MIKATPSVMNINSNKSNSGNKFIKEHTEHKTTPSFDEVFKRVIAGKVENKIKNKELRDIEF